MIGTYEEPSRCLWKQVKGERLILGPTAHSSLEGFWTASWTSSMPSCANSEVCSVLPGCRPLHLWEAAAKSLRPAAWDLPLRVRGPLPIWAEVIHTAEGTSSLGFPFLELVQVSDCSQARSNGNRTVTEGSSFLSTVSHSSVPSGSFSSQYFV